MSVCLSWAFTRPSCPFGSFAKPLPAAKLVAWAQRARRKGTSVHLCFGSVSRVLYAGYGTFRVRIAVTNGSLPTFSTDPGPREHLMYKVLGSSSASLVL